MVLTVALEPSKLQERGSNPPARSNFSECRIVWLFRLLWEQEIVCSNHTTRTKTDMTAPYANIAYAPLALEYDRDRFIYEYDRFVLPRSRPIYNGVRDRDATVALNHCWGMIDPDIYSKQNASAVTSWQNGQTDKGFQGQGDGSSNISWLQAIMTQMVVNDDDDGILQEAGRRGSLPARNFAPHRPWQLKPEWAKLNLKLVDFIYNRLCLSRVIWISCVSLEPGRCAIIHRDSMRLYEHGHNPLRNNGLAQAGYVVIVINISNGGVPMYWALDHDLEHALLADDSIYISSDYFLHGVPVVSSRRRQVRVMGVPGPGFDSLLDRSRAVILPDNYQYLNQGASMY